MDYVIIGREEADVVVKTHVSYDNPEETWVDSRCGNCDHLLHTNRLPTCIVESIPESCCNPKNEDNYCSNCGAKFRKGE